MNIFVTNARSLQPKIESLVTAFEELELHVAVVTESWLKPGQKLLREIAEYENGPGISVIHKSRETRRGRNAGGGVAILFNKDKIRLAERKIRRGNNEIVCVIGKITGMSRHLAIIGAYIPPPDKSEEN